MESQAKHGDPIFWHVGRDTLLVNLFIPAQLDWNRIALAIETDYPASGLVTLDLAAASTSITARDMAWAAAGRCINGRPPSRPAAEPVQAGMILTNEPSYYEPGSHGMRLENAMQVVAAPAGAMGRPARVSRR